MHDLSRLAEHEPHLLDTMSKVVRSGWWLNGPETTAFSKEFACYRG